MPPARQTEKLQALADVICDPVGFARAFLGHDLWSTQEAILRDVAAYPRTVVRACHSSSKSFSAAEAVLWWITRFRESIVVTTAPTWTQVKDVLWAEVHKAVVGARIDYAPYLNQTELRLGPGRFAIGLSTNEGVRFQGFHAPHVLLILDEAPGVRGDIWEAILGIMAGGDVHVLALGNPTISSGPFYDAFAKERTLWRTHVIDAFDTPNLLGDPEHGIRAMTPENIDDLSDDELAWTVRSYLITRRYVKDMWVKFGRDPLHPIWQARVRGQFPLQSDQSLIWLDWLEQARYREAAVPEDAPLRAGVDVAGPGEDETVVYVVDGAGGGIVDWKAWSRPDPRGEVLAFLTPYKPQLVRVNVDTAGIGYYFAKHLRDQGFKDVIGEVNVGVAPRDSEQFANLKAELYWGLRLRFQQGDVAGLTDDETISQLASILYEHTARGQVQIESKEDARKRGVSSPDRAEALMLAFGDVGVPGIVEYYRRLLEQRQAEAEPKPNGVGVH